MIRLFLISCLLLLGITTTTFSQQATDSTKKEWRHSFDWGLDAMAFGRTTSLVDEIGSLNPDNRIAKLSQWNSGLYLRPDLYYSNRYFEVNAKPRLNFDIREKTDGDDIVVNPYFQELFTKVHLNKNLYLKGGRYLKNIGTSIFVNPSNPFLLDVGTLNPKYEPNSREFIELNLSTDKNIDLSLVANIGKGREEIFNENFFDFKRIYGLTFDYYANSGTLGGVLSASEDQRYHIGLYGQYNLTEALLVWIDGSANYNANRFYPIEDHHTDLLAYEMENGDLNEDFILSGLVGGSYTFSFGPTLTLEYFYNGKGYTDEEYTLYNELIEDATNYNFDVRLLLSDLNLGRAINTGMPYIRRHYFFTQFGENDLWGKFSYNLRYFYSLDDNSSQSSALIEYNITDYLELFNVSLINFGNHEKNFSRLVDYQIMFGIIGKF